MLHFSSKLSFQQLFNSSGILPTAGEICIPSPDNLRTLSLYFVQTIDACWNGDLILLQPYNKRHQFVCLFNKCSLYKLVWHTQLYARMTLLVLAHHQSYPWTGWYAIVMASTCTDPSHQIFLMAPDYLVIFPVCGAQIWLLYKLFFVIGIAGKFLQLFH